MQKTIQYSLQQQTERFIESIENLGFNIDTLKPYLGKDYSSILVDMLFALKEIGYFLPWRSLCRGSWRRRPAPWLRR